MKVLFPPVIETTNTPVIFLAGPIQGALDWQSEAARIIHMIDPTIVIACPRREYIDGDFVYEKQVDWETEYLGRAGKDGLIMFWLAKEHEHNCERAYAQTTRFELAEWKMKHQLQGAKLVVGIEEGFTNARYIRRRFGQDCPEVSICDTLEGTCEMAVKELTK